MRIKECPVCSKNMSIRWFSREDGVPSGDLTFHYNWWCKSCGHIEFYMKDTGTLADSYYNELWLRANPTEQWMK